MRPSERDQASIVARTVIIPAITQIGAYSEAATQLVLGTGIQESLLFYRQQQGGGPALGLFQMEGATHDDIWTNFLAYRLELSEAIRALLTEDEGPFSDTLRVNDRYAAAMCRVHYLRVAEALPAKDDIEAQAAYWKQHYNTPLGAGSAQDYVEKWRIYVG